MSGKRVSVVRAGTEESVRGKILKTYTSHDWKEHFE